jgi:thiol-disulfide isomerase/thioredoxin
MLQSKTQVAAVRKTERRLVMSCLLRLVFAAMMIVFAGANASGQESIATQFALKDVNGRVVRLSAYRGKVVLINFWATWCPPCRAEMPDLVRLQREYAKQGLQIIGITYPPQTKTLVRRFARSLKVNYPIILGTRQIKARFSSEETLPLTVVIDRDGKVTDVISGILLRQEFDEKIKPLLTRNTEGEMRNAKSDH